MRKQENKKKLTKKWLLLYIGFAIGVLFFLVPFIFGVNAKQQQDSAREAYQNTESKADNTQLLTAIKRYNKKIYAGQQTRGGYDGSEDAKKILKKPDQAIGYLEIPAINLDPMMVYYGTSDKVLEKGIGNLTWTSMPSGGKNSLSILTGHSGLANQIFFDNIKFLKKGDLVFVHTFGQEMAYKVTSKIVISPDKKSDQKKLYVQKNKDMIGLMTCTPVFLNTHRLIVFAKRVPLKNAAGSPVISRDFWSLEHLSLMIIGLFFLILILITIISKYNQKKRRVNGQTK